MANEFPKYQNFIGGLIENNPLTSGGTTLTSAGLAAINDGVASTERMSLVLDPDGIYGAPEIVWITALTTGASSATISRGKEGTVAREHLRDIPWVHATTNFDIPVRRYKTANETINNSATLQNDDHLFFPIGANEVWVVEYNLFVSAVSATSDFKIALALPAGATSAMSIVGLAAAAASAEADAKFQSFTSAATALTAGIQADSSSNGFVRYQAYVATAGTAGTVMMQWAQATANASDTVLRLGSFLLAHRMG